MNGKCIFCLKDNPLTIEHVVPESIGGSLCIKALCCACNSMIGTEVDGPFVNSIAVSLARFVRRIPGKSGSVPNPFGGIGVSPNGMKVRLDDHFRPHIIPSVEKEVMPNGEIVIRMIFDKDDEPGTSELVLKTVRRALKQKYPLMPDSEVNARAHTILKDSRNQITESSEQPTLKYEFSIDPVAMRLEYIKIAYEIAFHLFGYEYVLQSSSAAALRNAIRERQREPMVHGEFPLIQDYLDSFFPEQDKHILMVLNGGAYIRLFGLSAIVEFEEHSSQFMCPNDRARVFALDFITRRYSEELFVERLVNMNPQQGV